MKQGRLSTLLSTLKSGLTNTWCDGLSYSLYNNYRLSYPVVIGNNKWYDVMGYPIHVDAIIHKTCRK